MKEDNILLTLTMSYFTGTNIGYFLVPRLPQQMSHFSELLSYKPRETLLATETN